MKDLKNNQLYQKINSSFKNAGFEENIETTQGFILGLICRGHGSSDNKALTLTNNILNGGNIVSGSGIALFTTMLIELERQLKDQKLELFIPTSNDNLSKAVRLQSCIDIAYGYMLGFCCEGNPVAGSIVETDYAQKNAQLKDNMKYFDFFKEIDINDDFSEQDFIDVVEVLHSMIQENYTLMK